MSYSAPNRLRLPARHSIDTQSNSWLHAAGFPAAAAWPSADMAIYVPIAVPNRVLVHKLWFASADIGTGNVDMALYSATGTAVVAATETAKSATSTEQVFDVTDTVIGPGLYYVGLSCSNNTDTFNRFSFAAPMSLAFGILTEASAYPLPATATFAANQTLAYIPIAGLLLETTVA